MWNNKELIKKIATHLGLVFLTVTILSFIFLKVYLPFYTNHGQTVTVPNIEGYSIDELEDFLSERDLTFEVNIDSGFNAEAKPFAVLKQNPNPDSKVKGGRKIYVTLNARNAPLIKMPNLVNSPLKNAQEILGNIGLVRGEIIYIPDIGMNVVLEQKYRGRNIQEGFEIPKGSQVDLVVGDGYGNQTLEVPSLLGSDEIDAEFLIIGSGLIMGNINYVETDSVAAGIIIRQLPQAGTPAKTGDQISIWISENKKSSNNF